MKRFFRVLISLISITACNQPSEEKRFRLRDDTGIDFTNEIVENDSMHLMALEYFYRGGGVAIGDLNNDRLPDVILSGNMVPSRLYLNQGGLKFQDVTKASGFYNEQWINGISLVDINDDGLIDVYLCAGGSNDSVQRKNLFFVQQQRTPEGIPVFKDEAAAWGLDGNQSTTQAAFFDYDRDDDLDVILVNTDPDEKNPNVVRDKVSDGSAPNTDRLFENRLNEEKFQTFVDVSQQAGIVNDGFSLGLTITDINRDGWPDVYVANDHLSNDILYINQQDGTFRNQAPELIRNQSYFSMGVFAKDVDNNGLTDIFTLDMLPESNERRKNMAMAMNLARFQLAQEFGYQAQFMKNTLQLNLGVDRQGQPVFAEVAQLAGIQDTDWSWGSVIADFDLDGDNDIIVANGYARNITDMDFVAYQERQNFFSKSLDHPEYRNAITEQPPILLSNYAFRNEGGLQFSDVSREWGLDGPNLSNGMAYGDLDLDGDLDLVINHINQRASVYENTTEGPHQHFLKVLPVRASGSPALGAKAVVYQGGQGQYQELYPVQGYQSTQEAGFHFGLGTATQVDSLVITWSQGALTKHYHLPSDSLYVLTAPSGQPRASPPVPTASPGLFTLRSLPLSWQHRPSSPYGDTDKQALMHQTFSREGPSLAAADIDGNQLTDVFVGSGPEQAGTLLMQSEAGVLVKKTFDKGGPYEDRGAAWLDADGDGDLDLFVASGNATYREGHESLQDRLYRQSADGFKLASEWVPDMKTFTQEVVAVDFDRDGDEDLLVFGRMVSGEFPTTPRSYLLQNDGKKFTDVSAEYLPESGRLGMVSCAETADLDQDGTDEIIFSGEWQPIRVLAWKNNRYEEVSAQYGLADLKGWWQSLTVTDLNQDGFPDILAGNAGLNNPYAGHLPLELWAADLDGDQHNEPLLGWHMVNQQGEKKLYPAFSRDDLVRQLPSVKSRYATYHDFATVTLTDLLALSQNQPTKMTINGLSSVALINQAGRDFIVQELPREAQIGPITAFVAQDFNHDGSTDVLGLGNTREMSVSMGWNDNSKGVLLLNDHGDYRPVPNAQTQLYVSSEVQDAVSINSEQLLLSSYADSLRVLSWTFSVPDTLPRSYTADPPVGQ